MDKSLALALDPTQIFRALNRTADPWQRDLPRSTEPQVVLNWKRKGDGHVFH
jgi:hypothetical protein